MTRRLLNLVTALSLLLCVAACVLWAWSYREPVDIQFERRAVRWEAVSRGGRLWVSNDPQRLAEQAQWHAEWARLWREFKHLVGPPGLRSISAGEAMMRHGVAMNAHQRIPKVKTPAKRYSVPHALPVLLAGLLPASRFARWWRRRRRAPRGLCARCGYDLRATPGRCPECGTEAPASPAP